MVLTHRALNHPDAQVFELGKLAEGVNASSELVVVKIPEWMMGTNRVH